MKLTNRQIDVLVDKVFNEVSLPIIEENNEKIKNFIPSEKIQYFKDKKEYDELVEKITLLEDTKEDILNKYKHKKYLGYNFSYNPMSSSKEFTAHLAKESISLREYPSKTQIEAEIILIGAEGIKDLIQEFKTKYNSTSHTT